MTWDFTYEKIEEVNKQIKTIDFKERPYAQVSQRIIAFRKLFPLGTIKTDIVSIENGVCIIKATAGYYLGDTFIILGTGTAYEKEGSSFINKASFIENCETSAVGRALGMCGLGVDLEVASYEEVVTANLNTETITAEQKKALAKMCKEDGIPEGYICELYGVSEIKELIVPKFTNCVNNWDKLKAKYNERNNN